MSYAILSIIILPVLGGYLASLREDSDNHALFKRVSEMN